MWAAQREGSVATIKDGMKIGLGLLLFKWLLGIGSCAVTIGVLSCLVCVGKDKAGHRSEPASAYTSAAPARRSTAAGQTVRYPKGCNLRAEPEGSATKVGFAAAGKRYVVLERQGPWRRITLDDGTEGWAACAVGIRPASRPAEESE